MRYERVIVTRYGGPEVISLIEEYLPAPQPEVVRVKLFAAGASPPDVLARGRRASVTTKRRYDVLLSFIAPGRPQRPFWRLSAFPCGGPLASSPQNVAAITADMACRPTSA
jgi:hypothetical protein